MTVIDRFENNTAILETDGVITETERCLLPANAREGDVVTERDGVWTVDVAATEQRRAEIREFMKRLMKK